MLDRKLLNNISDIKNNCEIRRGQFDTEQLLSLHSNLKQAQQLLEEAQQQKNQLSQLFAETIRSKGDVAPIKLKAEQNKTELQALQSDYNNIEAKFNDLWYSLPNILQSDVPVGKDETANVEVRRWGTIKNVKTEAHYDYGQKRGWFDFERATKIAMSRFTALKGDGAKLERALGQFMLDHQTAINGYTEMAVPLIVNDQTMFGTGQLPKFSEDLYKLETDSENDLYLIPTAEVPLTNLYRNEFIDLSNLPIKFCALTSCFRKEAGSYGKDVKGYLRQHQFNKVELVVLCRAEDSLALHEKMVLDAESILQALDLPYRVMLLCSGDTGFNASKCYDLEVWLPFENKYREISSCSNCTDFQARRSQIKYKDEAGESQFVHSLNGSGLAVGRTLIAVLENNIQADGRLLLPKVLRKYFDGAEYI